MTAKSLEALPGPGAYSSFTNDAYNPSFTMGARLAPPKGSGSPGPGEYNVMDNVVFTEVGPMLTVAILLPRRIIVQYYQNTVIIHHYNKNFIFFLFDITSSLNVH
jgi:hypothetical protein